MPDDFCPICQDKLDEDDYAPDGARFCYTCGWNEWIQDDEDAAVGSEFGLDDGEDWGDDSDSLIYDEDENEDEDDDGESYDY